jgi:hypothetical protein
MIRWAHSCAVSPKRADWLNGFCYDWLLRGRKRTFTPFHCGVVTTYALEVGAAGDGDNRDHAFSAFLAACCSIHEMILPIFTPYGSLVPWARDQIAFLVFIETRVAKSALTLSKPRSPYSE